jgi:hypothetical protein
VATISLIFWIGIIFMGRWIGFTSTRGTPTAEPDVNIEQFLPK